MHSFVVEWLCVGFLVFFFPPFIMAAAFFSRLPFASITSFYICDRPPRNESEVPSGCLELERKMGVGGVRCRF